jgi:hypothetical protein
VAAVTVLGDILLGYYAAGSSYADQAIVAAVEELEKHADVQSYLVARVEMAMICAADVSIPWERMDEFLQAKRNLDAAAE